ncbi:hypothetical protein [Arthrobacter wenxiniae]|uniref:Uncharacterized protein n=1 Tax=Arthrobacter wenxiniae TaxID=2713570 RepID=A0A7Y7IFJ0_9MICC|nr:hypothetical protein [Arthrobacter wenxiniae]NVM94532.1 hypothetical protein [Arthrobacter wenxiniae]
MTSLVQDAGHPRRFVGTVESAGAGTTIVDDITFAARCGPLGRGGC